MKTAVLVLILVASAMLPGCFKSKQEVTVMPDGSGKMTLTVSYNKKQLDEAFSGMPGMQPPRNANPTDINTENLEGFAAFAKSKNWTDDDGWEHTTITGYFEDINKVKVFHVANSAGVKKPWLTFTYKKLKDGGYRLECVDNFNTNPGAAKRADQIPPEMEDMVMPTVEAAMKGLRMERSFLMPGDILQALDCTEKKGRVATNLISTKDMKGLADFKKLTENKHYKITCKKSAVTDIEAAAFRSEMDDAIDAWEEIKKKAAEEKAKAEKKAAAEKEKADKEKAAEDK